MRQCIMVAAAVMQVMMHSHVRDCRGMAWPPAAHKKRPALHMLRYTRCCTAWRSAAANLLQECIDGVCRCRKSRSGSCGEGAIAWHVMVGLGAARGRHTQWLQRREDSQTNDPPLSSTPRPCGVLPAAQRPVHQPRTPQQINTRCKPAALTAVLHAQVLWRAVLLHTLALKHKPHCGVAGVRGCKLVFQSSIATVRSFLWLPRRVPKKHNRVSAITCKQGAPWPGSTLFFEQNALRIFSNCTAIWMDACCADQL